MPGYILTLTDEHVSRLVHEKVRLREARPIYWLRQYLADVKDYDLQRETPITRLVARELPLLIASGDWRISDDPRWIAGQIALRTQDVKVAVDRLVALGRIVRVAVDNTGNHPGQAALFGGAVAEPAPSQHRASIDLTPEPAQPEPRNEANGAGSQLTDNSPREEKRREVVNPRDRSERPRRHRLDLSRELDRLLTLAGRHADEGTRTVYESYLRTLTEADIAGVVEAVRSVTPTNPATYISASLRRAAERRASLNGEPPL